MVGVIHWLLALLPGLLMTGLVLLSMQATNLPEVTADPVKLNYPRYIGSNDQIFLHLYDFVDYLVETFVFSFPVWGVITALTVWLHWRYWSKDEPQHLAIYRFLPIVLYMIGFLIVVFEPTHRLDWSVG